MFAALASTFAAQQAGRRLFWGALAAVAAALLVVARLLPPDPRGIGTHLALGLPPCGFLLWLGVPCPACGLTTSFAHLARFELLAALRAHPVGLPLYLLTLFTLPAALRFALRAEPLRAPWGGLSAERWAVALLVALLVTWCARLLARVSP